MDLPTNKPRYTITVDEDLLKEIDDFRFENRYPSRAAATLDIIKLGMKAIKRQQIAKTKKEQRKIKQEARNTKE